MVTNQEGNEKMSYEYKDSFGTTYMLHCEKGRYARDGSIALCMIVDEEAYDEDGEIECYPGEQYGYATVNVGAEPSDGNCAFVDTNNLSGIVDFVLNNGIGELTGRIERSGFCTYPEVRFYDWFLASCPEM